MSDLTIAHVKDDLAGRLHGTTVNKITNINSVFRRAAGNLLRELDPDETRRTKQVTLYDGVTDYATEADLKDKKVIDIRPQDSRNDNENPRQKFSKEFDRKRKESWFTVMKDSGLTYLRISKSITPSKSLLDDLVDSTGWAATASAQNLAEDSIIYPAGALKFDLAAGANPSSGYIESSSIDSVDLTDFDEQSAAFVELYIPTAEALAAFISIDLRWGNGNAAYWSRTVTTPHLGSFKVGRNIVRVDWNGATETGSVDPSAVDYARITVNYNGAAISGIRVSNLFFSIGKIHDIEYYSKFLFSHNGVWQDTVTNDDTKINLDTASYNLYLDEVEFAAKGQLQGSDAVAEAAAVEKKLHGSSGPQGSYNRYKNSNPSQAIRPQGSTIKIKSFKKK